MVGRAGRTGLDPFGESVLVAPLASPPAALQYVATLISETLPPVRSCLLRHFDRSNCDASLTAASSIRGPIPASQSGCLQPLASEQLSRYGAAVASVACAIEAGSAAGLARLVLEVVDSGLASSPASIFAAAQRTLLCVQIGEPFLRVLVSGCLMYMLALHVNMLEAAAMGGGMVASTAWLVECAADPQAVHAHTAIVVRSTQKGRAACSVSLSPCEALLLYNELAAARRRLVLQTPAHALYCCMPIAPVIEPPWRGGSGQVDTVSFWQLWESYIAPRRPDIVSIAALQLPADVEGQKMYHTSSPLLETSFLAEARAHADGARGAALKRGAALAKSAHAEGTLGAANRAALLLHMRARRLFSTWLLTEFLDNPHPWGGEETDSRVWEAPVQPGSPLHLERLLSLAGVTPDALEKLLDESAGFAGTVASFCTQLSWMQLARAATEMRDVLKRGYPPSLQLFAHLPAMTRSRAAAISAAGWTTLTALASAPLPGVIACLRGALPLEPPPWTTNPASLVSAGAHGGVDDAMSAPSAPPERSVPRKARKIPTAYEAACEREVTAAATIQRAAQKYLEDRVSVSLFGQHPRGQELRRFPLGHCLPLELVKHTAPGTSTALVGGAGAITARPQDILHSSGARAASQTSVASSVAAGAALLDSIAEVAGGLSATRDDYGGRTSQDSVVDDDSDSSSSDSGFNSSSGLSDGADSVAASLFSEAGKDALSPTAGESSPRSSSGSRTSLFDDNDAYMIDAHDTPQTQLTAPPAQYAVPGWLRRRGAPSAGDSQRLVKSSFHPSVVGTKRPRELAITERPAEAIAPVAPACETEAESCDGADLLQAVLDASPLRHRFCPPEPLTPYPQLLSFVPPQNSVNVPAVEVQQRGASVLEIDPTGPLSRFGSLARLSAAHAVGVQRGASALNMTEAALQASVLAGRSAAPRLPLMDFLPRPPPVGTFSVLAPITPGQPHVMTTGTNAASLALRAHRAAFPDRDTHRPTLQLRDYTQDAVALASDGRPSSSAGAVPAPISRLASITPLEAPCRTAHVPSPHHGEAAVTFTSVREELSAATSSNIVARMAGFLQRDLDRVAAVLESRAFSVVFARGFLPRWSIQHPARSSSCRRDTMLTLGAGISSGASARSTAWVCLADPPPAPLSSWRGYRSVPGAMTTADLHSVLLLSFAFLGVGGTFSTTLSSPSQRRSTRTGATVVASVCKAFYAAYVDTIRFFAEVCVHPVRARLESALADQDKLKVLVHAQSALLSARECNYKVHGELADPLVAAWLLEPDAPEGAPTDQARAAGMQHDTRYMSYQTTAEVSKYVHALEELEHASISITDGLNLCSESYLHLPISSNGSLHAAYAFLQSSCSCLGELAPEAPTSLAGQYPSCSQAPHLAAIAWAAMGTLSVKLRTASLELPFRYIEMPTLRVIADLGADGISADNRTLTRYVITSSERLQVIQQALRDLCPAFVSPEGGPLDPRRATHVARALFIFLNAPCALADAGALEGLCDDPLRAARATTNDALSHIMSVKDGSDPTVASKAAADFCKLLLEFRGLLAMHQRVLRPLQRAVLGDSKRESLRQGCGVIRPTFDYHTATGRLSCSSPNLQALPKDVFFVSGVARPSLHEELTRTDGFVWVRRRGALVRVPLETALRDAFQARCLVVLARQSYRLSLSVAGAAIPPIGVSDSAPSTVGGPDAAASASASATAPASVSPIISRICSRIGSVTAIHYTRNLMVPPISSSSSDAGASEDIDTSTTTTSTTAKTTRAIDTASGSVGNTDRVMEISKDGATGSEAHTGKHRDTMALPVAAPVAVADPLRRAASVILRAQAPPRPPAAADSDSESIHARAAAGPQVQKPPPTLVQFWRELGFTYSDAAAAEINQVTVLFRVGAPVSPGLHQPLQAYVYPADKVFRLAAPIFLPPPLPAGMPCSQQPWSTPTAVNVRDVFVARPGFVLMAADYCQIEVRVLAHLAQDPALIAVLNQADDVFKSIAAVWLGRPDAASVTPMERAQVKQLVYAILYGASTAAFAAVLGVPVAEAEVLTEGFRRAFPAVFSFLKGVVEHCKAVGYVDTICGRRRHLARITGCDGASARRNRDGSSTSGLSDAAARRAARQAVNTTCQGSAADIIKLATANVSCVLEAIYNPSSLATTGAADSEAAVNGFLARPDEIPFAVPGQRTQTVARIVLQVHDELVLEVQREQAHNVSLILRHCMENAVALRVPLKVTLAVGERYGSLKSYDPTAGAAAAAAAQRSE
jgi:DNA polymerase I-like protein with 3'-5' exonuclease and polymerase domains